MENVYSERLCRGFDFFFLTKISLYFDSIFHKLFEYLKYHQGQAFGVAVKMPTHSPIRAPAPSFSLSPPSQRMPWEVTRGKELSLSISHTSRQVGSQAGRWINVAFLKKGN